MNLGGDRFFSRVKEHYDKVIALVVLLVFVCSLLLLAVKVGMMRQIEADFNGWMKGLRPVNEYAKEVDPTPYETAKITLTAPPLLAGGTGGVNAVWMFVPETRFNCRECRHPVSITADICPFCKTPVVPPEPETLDHDSDGMPTEWERRYGLDPFDPSDANKDFDGDGYSNLEEYLAETDPTDPESRPAAIDRLTLERISGTQFGLRFNSRVRTQSGYKFGLNYKLPDGQTKTDFVEIGAMVAGFKVEKYEEKLVPGSLGMDDKSELTLLAPKGEHIVLVKDKPVQYVELTAHFRFELRGNSEGREVKKGEDFALDGRGYTVIDIDAKDRRVIIRDNQSLLDRTVKQDPDKSGGV